MAIYHLSVKTVSRSAGRSATAAAAYRSAERIEDKRLGLVHDYSKKRGVEHSEIFLPKDAPVEFLDRSFLWNQAETSETRKNSTVAREFEIALPAELSKHDAIGLAKSFAQELVAKYRFAADVSVHSASRGGSDKNRHAHILCTTRSLDEKGFGAKTRSLDERTSGEVDWIREKWAVMQNQALEKAGVKSRVSAKSLEAQGIDREANIHHGPAITSIIRRGEASRVLQRVDLVATKKLEAIHQSRERLQEIDKSIISLETDIKPLYKEHVSEFQKSSLAEAKKQIDEDAKEAAKQYLKSFSFADLKEELRKEKEKELQKEQAQQKAKTSERSISHGHDFSR